VCFSRRFSKCGDDGADVRVDASDAREKMEEDRDRVEMDMAPGD
jgi:hypothetical protein